MTILSRYVIKNILFLFVSSLTTLTVLVGFFFITRIVVNLGAPLNIALAMFPYTLPEVFSLVVPFTILFAVCPTFGKMAASKEFISLKAAGIPPWKALLPAWILAFGISLLMVWVNDLSYSWGRKEAARVLISGMQTLVVNKLAEDGKFSMPDGSVTIEAEHVDATGQLFDTYFYFSKGEIRGTASQARLSIDYSREPPVFGLSLNNAQFENENAGIVLSKDFFYEFIPENLSDSLHRNDPPLYTIPKELEKIEQTRQEYRQRIAARLTFGFVTGDYSAIKESDLINRDNFECELNGKRNRYRLTGPRYWACGFACFFFVWVGAPLAIRLNRADLLANFFISFSIILVIYYPLLVFSFQEIKDGSLHPMFAWTGNAALAVLGCILLKQVHRH